jgi:hypothetical protein
LRKPKGGSNFFNSSVDSIHILIPRITGFREILNVPMTLGCMGSKGFYMDGNSRFQTIRPCTDAVWVKFYEKVDDSYGKAGHTVVLGLSPSKYPN